MKKRILVSVINNLVVDQRVEKVCASLYSRGHDLFLVGTTWGGKATIKRNYPTQLLPMIRTKGFVFFLEFNLRLFFFLLRRGRRFDVFWANDLDSLLPNYLVAKLYKKTLICDSHEIYSQLPSLKLKTIRKKIWKTLEAYLLPRCNFVYTVSSGYANWFRKEYGIEAIVLRNVPRKADYKQQKVPVAHAHPLGKQLVLYQGALNTSRGLEVLLESAKILKQKPITFWIIGSGPIEQKLHKRAKELGVWQQNVFFKGRIEPKELKTLTAMASLGLSIEEDGGLSYRYALPNKIFDYVHAGIPILGSYLPEIRECIENNSLGGCITEHCPEQIASKIEELLALPEGFFDPHLKKAQDLFFWEKEEIVLLEWERSA